MRNCGTATAARRRLFGAKLVGAVSLATLAAASASAQSTDQSSTAAEADESADENVIVVTGFRSSLADALNKKRESGNVTDNISAEDIGKSADQNIAEALQRVTGVAIQRDEAGEGSVITIRGASPDLNNVKLNGVSLSSSGTGQAVDFAQFSADILSSIEVVKTPSASHDEGSLGATVILRGFRPLDSRRDRLNFEVSSRYNDLSDLDRFRVKDDIFGGDHEFTFSASKKFFNDTLGVSIVASKEQQTTRTDNIFITQYIERPAPDGAINLETGERITEFDYGDGLGLRPLVGLAPQNFRYNTDRRERDRESISAIVQYRPTDSTDIELNFSYQAQTTDRVGQQLNINPLPAESSASSTSVDPRFANDLIFDPSNLTFIRSVATPLSRRSRPGSVRITNAVDLQEQENLVLSGRIEQRVGNFTFELTGGRSETKQGSSDRFSARFQNARPRTPGTLSGAAADNLLQTGYDCQPDFSTCQFILDTVVPSGFIDDTDNLIFGNVVLRDRDNRDEFNSVFFDVDWDQSFGPITQFQAGFKWTDRTKTNRQDDQAFQQERDENGDRILTILRSPPFTFSDFSAGSTPQDFGVALGLARDSVTDGIPAVSAERVLGVVDGFIPLENLIVTRNLANTNTIEEEVIGGYLQADYELAGGRIFGDFGIRVARTTLDSFGASGFDLNPGVQFINDTNAGFFNGDPTNTDPAAALAALGIDLNENPPATPSTGRNSYTNWLPSFNFNWLVRDDLIVRFAASQTIARPSLDNLTPNFEIRERQFDPDSIARGGIGNPTLSPFKSTNLDLSVEWYFAPDSLFSIALFNKDLSDFVEESDALFFYRDFRDQLYDANGDLIPDVNFVASINDTLLPFSGGDNQPGCFPNREPDFNVAEGEFVCDLLRVTRPRNGRGGYVRGLEASFQHNFTWLPGILSGLGVIANYTYSDSRVDEEVETVGGQDLFFPEAPLEGTSEHTFNATGFYEKDGLLLRLAYNYRSDYLLDRASDGVARWQAGFGTLDLSGSVDITDFLSVNFSAVNLTDTAVRRYQTIVNQATLPAEPTTLGNVNTSRLSRLQNTGTIYRVGFRFSF